MPASGSVRALLVAAILVLATAFSGPVLAQSVNPTASSVKEEQLLRELDRISGRVSIPDQKSADLVKPAGREWREFHQGTMHWIGGIAILGVLAGLVLFWLVRGKITIDSGLSGIKVLRFNAFERFVHWLTAGSFLVLGLTGLNITFGKYLLMPLIGPDAFAAASQFGKYAHNYLAWPFMLGLLFMLLVWIRDNIPEKADLAWIKSGGGLFSKGVHPEAKKFNAGQKTIFWSVIIGGAALSVSGFFLLFPSTAGGYANWQLAQIVHGVVSVVLVAIMVAHIYIGSVGMQGAFDAMGSGEVDLNWAKEHHSVWAKTAQVVGNETTPATPPKAVPAE
jgi:formate dehydrogenase subunit gamma